MHEFAYKQIQRNGWGSDTAAHPEEFYRSAITAQERGNLALELVKYISHVTNED